MKVVEKGVKFAGYELEPEGFLVEDCDVSQENQLLSAKQKEILIKPIQNVIAVYRVGDNYTYFDTNAAFVSGIETISDLNEGS